MPTRSRRPRPLQATTTPRFPRRRESWRQSPRLRMREQKPWPQRRLPPESRARAHFAPPLRLPTPLTATVTIVFGGLNRFLAAALVTGIVLAAPATALASGCGGGPSAVNVYKECLPSGGGGKPAGGGKPTGAGSSKHASTGHAGSNSTTHVVVSGPAARAIRHAGKDRRALAGLLKGSVHETLVGSGISGGANAPSAVGSAFDLGSGPTALLIALAATAALILGGSGVRVWRHRERP